MQKGGSPRHVFITVCFFFFVFYTQDVKESTFEEEKQKTDAEQERKNPPAFLNVDAPCHRRATEQQGSLCFDLIFINF